MSLGKVALLSLLFAAAAAPAHAATYCIGDVDCPPGGVPVSTWGEARAAGAANASSDDYLLGEGTFTGPIRVPGGDRLIGSGRGKTFIAGGPDWTLTSVLEAYMSDVTLVLDDARTLGSDADGGELERVDIDGSALTTPGVGIRGWGTPYRGGRLVLAEGTAIAGGVEGEDLVIDAPVGFYEGDYGGSLRRTIVRAETGVVAAGQGVAVEDTVLHMRGDAPVGLRSAGSQFIAGAATITARNVTIAGPGTGVAVDVEGGCSNRHAGGQLDQVAITGFETHLRRRYLPDEDCGEDPVPAEIVLEVRRSAFDPERVVDEGGRGAIVFDDASPVGTDLKLIDVAGGDLRPRWDSPLIDAGTEASAADVRGLPRVGPPDVGAYEYQFAAPVARAVVTPEQGAPGGTFTFDARASTDVDGDPLTFAWTFSRGGTADGPLVERVLGAGTHTATVTVSDPTGRSSSASATAHAQPPAAPPADPPAGPPAAVPPARSAARPAARSRSSERVVPRGMTVRARRLGGARIRYRLSGSIRLPSGVETSRCDGGHVVVRVPTKPGRDRARYARVGDDCRFSMRITIPRRYRGGYVRLHPVFRGGTDLAPVVGRPLTLRPR